MNERKAGPFDKYGAQEGEDGNWYGDWKGGFYDIIQNRADGSWHLEVSPTGNIKRYEKRGVFPTVEAAEKAAIAILEAA